MPEPGLEDHIANLHAGDPRVRRNAAWTLGRTRDPRIVAPLIAALDDDDVDVRLRAAEALGNLPDEQAVQPLAGVLAGDPDERVRAQAALSLGRQGDERGVAPLIAALTEAAASVRVAVAEALGTLPDPRVIPGLVRAMLDDADDNVRHFAARSLGYVGGSSVGDALLPVLDGDAPAATKIRVLEVLVNLYERRAIDAAARLVDDADPDLSATAQWALRRLGE